LVPKTAPLLLTITMVALPPAPVSLYATQHQSQRTSPEPPFWLIDTKATFARRYIVFTNSRPVFSPVFPPFLPPCYFSCVSSYLGDSTPFGVISVLPLCLVPHVLILISTSWIRFGLAFVCLIYAFHESRVKSTPLLVALSAPCSVQYA